jgi:dienelactone hydrolase
MRRREVQVREGEAVLAGALSIPDGAKGVVLFAHGSGSSRFSPRNQFVAEHLQRSGLGTLLMDLLTEQEEALDVRTTELRFDIDLLARRVIAAVDWVAHAVETADLSIGCFGASTGAAAALVAAAERPQAVGAVVSRGGRPDLAGASLGAVKAPTLLIVGGADHQVLELNRWALERLGSEAELRVVERATHLFEEPGALEQVAQLATDWFPRFV